MKTKSANIFGDDDDDESTKKIVAKSVSGAGKEKVNESFNWN